MQTFRGGETGTRLDKVFIAKREEMGCRPGEARTGSWENRAEAWAQRCERGAEAWAGSRECGAEACGTAGNKKQGWEPEQTGLQGTGDRVRPGKQATTR